MKKLIIIILLFTLTSCNGYNFYDILSTFGDPSPHIARSISFADTNYRSGYITGTLTFLPAQSESSITEYRLYWGNGPATKNSFIASFTPNGSAHPNSFVAIAPGDLIPVGATHFLVYSVKGTDEMSECASLKIQDLVVVQFIDLYPGNSSNPSRFTVINGIMYFGASYNGTGAHLFKSDGTVGGTSLLIQFNSSGPSVDLNTWMIEYAGKLYIRATNGSGAGQYGDEIWVYDPSSALVMGTNPFVIDINTTIGVGSNVSKPVALGGKLYFSATDNSVDTELYEYDPAQVLSGTNPLKIDINAIGPGTSSNPVSLTGYNGKLYFSATDGNFLPHQGIELWELTPAGSYSVGINPKVIDINSGAVDSSPLFLTVFNNKLYFQALQPSSGRELWVLDSSLINPGPTYDSSTNPKLIDVIPGGPGSIDPQGLTVFNDKLVFSATDPIHGREAWISDGMLSGSYMIIDQNSGIGDSIIGAPFVFKNKVYMSLNIGSTTELGISDGTYAGTNQIIINGATNADPQYFAALDGMVYFIADKGAPANNGFQIWRTDSTVAGTQQLTVGLLSTILANNPQELIEYKGKIYFRGTDLTGTNTEVYVLYYK